MEGSSHGACTFIGYGLWDGQSKKTAEGKAYLMSITFIHEVLKAFYADSLWEFEQVRGFRSFSIILVRWLT